LKLVATHDLDTFQVRQLLELEDVALDLRWGRDHLKPRQGFCQVRHRSFYLLCTFHIERLQFLAAVQVCSVDVWAVVAILKLMLMYTVHMARVGGGATFQLAKDVLASVDVQVLQTLACRNVCELRVHVRS